MKRNWEWIVFGVLGALVLSLPLCAGSSSARKSAEASAVVVTADVDTMRIEGERRFRANCGRCHAAPQKFPPRMMATALWYMRVWVTITKEDQRLILFYMTQ